MTTIRAEQYLKMLAWTPGQFAMGDHYPEIDSLSLIGNVETNQTLWRDIWPVNSVYTFSTVAGYMYLSSTSIADVGRIIFVAGLDAGFNMISGYGITNGQNQSIVTSLPGAGAPLNFFRINYVSDVTPALTRQVAQGTIYVARLTTPVGGVPPAIDTRAVIPQGNSRNSGFIYTVPRGYILAMRWFIISQDGSQQVRVRYKISVMTFSGATLLYLPTIRFQFAATIPGTYEFTIDPSVLIMPEMSDIVFEVLGTSPVAGAFSIASSSALIDYRYIKNLRFGSPSPLAG